MPLRIQKAKFAAVLATVFLFSQFSARANGQATTATAYRNSDLQVGGYFSVVHPDYGRRFLGYGAYAAYDFKPHWGAEFNFRQANSSDNDLSERTYELGVRYVITRKHRFNPYARASYGRGVFNFPPGYNGFPFGANLAFNLMAFGGGVDYNLTRSINIRGDYDYQHWFSFPDNTGFNYNRSLSPQALSVGVAYHFH
ncbi:outer membrane beta-barrel protein [Terriglobus sp. TAA 43]|uniref:outer membrane beta-barrel protein n=1 Tax=Terriglobus sp. TAA 43 TaxID=278961 RepID=UPI000645824D|nr:outer membrane beta-barrel protein [Terriglobus sp. TAA 43]